MSYSIILLFVVSFCLSCASSVGYINDLSVYEAEIKAWETKVEKDSANTAALRDLGNIYLRARKFEKAEGYLQKAYSLNPDDGKTALSFGMTLELQQKTNLALQVYQRYPEFSKYRRRIEGRYRKLKTVSVRNELQVLVQKEQELSDDRIQPNTIAIFPLFYSGDNPKYAPLGKGMSEILTTDLGYVPELQLLERIRLQVLLDELQLTKSNLVDPASAPRWGKLLAAGKIISGYYTVSEDKRLNMDLLALDAARGEVQTVLNENDVLDNFFKLEKNLVFSLIAEFDIELTNEQKEKIERIPTKNLQAFLAYCSGLEAEDAGNFKDAVKFHQKAVDIDPNFEAASMQSEAVASISDAAATGIEMVTEILDSTPSSEPTDEDTPTNETTPTDETIPTSETTSIDETTDLLMNRFENISTNIGSNFVPGEDTRAVAQDPEVIEPLPKPPPPPSKENN